MPKRSRIKDFLWRHSAGLAFLAMVVFVGFIGFVGYAYVVVTRKFDSTRRFDLPSRIYSDATPIVPGMSYPRALLEPKLNHVGYHEVPVRIANPGEYRYVDGNPEIYLQNFEYPDIEFGLSASRRAVAIDSNGVFWNGHRVMASGGESRGSRVRGMPETG